MSTGKITIKPVGADRFEEFYGERPPMTMRAWGMERDGEIIAIGGYYVTAARVVVFSDMKTDDVPKMTIWRAARRLMGKLNAPATCRSANDRLMEKLGWRRVTGDVWEWN